MAQKKLQITTYAIPNNTYLAKVAVKSAPGAPDVEALPLAVPEHDLSFTGSNHGQFYRLQLKHLLKNKVP